MRRHYLYIFFIFFVMFAGCNKESVMMEVADDFYSVDTAVNKELAYIYKENETILNEVGLSDIAFSNDTSFSIRILYKHSRGYCGNIITISFINREWQANQVDFVRNFEYTKATKTLRHFSRVIKPKSGWKHFINQINDNHTFWDYSNYYTSLGSGYGGDNISFYFKRSEKRGSISVIDLSDTYNDLMLKNFYKLKLLIEDEFGMKFVHCFSIDGTPEEYL